MKLGDESASVAVAIDVIGRRQGILNEVKAFASRKLINKEGERDGYDIHGDSSGGAAISDGQKITLLRIGGSP